MRCMRTLWRYILWMMIAYVLVLALPMQAQDVSGDLLNRINALRTSLGLAAYNFNGTLAAAAQNHATWMASTGNVSHTQSNGSTPSSRAATFGYSSSFVSENIYMGTNATVDTAWTWWLNSPIHYRGITNPSYSEIGIASAAGVGGVAYVLVFGNPGGWQPPAPAARSGSSDSAAAPPSFIVGVDAVGNIMHEIQPGQTLGDIALLYGYSWDLIPTLLAINGLTQEDIRKLNIGGVLLVPPWEGTYTPTPPPPSASVPDTAATPPPIAVTDMGLMVQTMTAQAAVPLPIETATPAPEVTEITTTVTTTEAMPVEVIQMITITPTTDTTAPVLESAASSSALTPQWSAATWTPTPSPAAVAALAENQSDAPDLAETTAPAGSSGGVPTLLWVAVVLQIGFVLGAGFEFLRRRAK